MIVKDLEDKIKEISHIASLTLAVTFLDLLPWLKLVVNDDGRLDMGVFFIGSVLKIIIFILVLRKIGHNEITARGRPWILVRHPPFCLIVKKKTGN